MEVTYKNQEKLGRAKLAAGKGACDKDILEQYLKLGGLALDEEGKPILEVKAAAPKPKPKEPVKKKK